MNGFTMSMTPCGVLYHCISNATGVRNYEEVDSRIISRDHLDEKGRSPYDRILRAGSYRTREIIQKDPSLLDVRVFRNAHESCSNVVSYLKSCGMGNRDIVDYFSGDATDEMCRSLREWGFDHHVFRNCMYDITRNNDPYNLNTATAVVMLFMITGFHGDPKESLPAFFNDVRTHAISVAMETGVLAESLSELVAESCPALGVMRRARTGTVHAKVYTLNPGPEGTVFGRMELAEFAINDVGATVSRRHMLVFRQDAAWYVRGLGSTNGTQLERESGENVVVEPPAAQRDPDYEPRSVLLRAGDILKLGFDTEYLVIPVEE